MNERQDPTRRQELLFILRYGGAQTDEIAERAVDLAVNEARAEQAAEIDRLRQDNRAAHASEQILQQQIDAQAKEIDRLRARVAALELAEGLACAAEADAKARLCAELDSYKDHLGHMERHTLPNLRREIQHHQDGKKRWRDRAEKAEAKLPPRFSASPAEVDHYLRQILAEDTLLDYQRAIGNRAVEEAAKDIRMETARLKADGVLEFDKDWAAASAADHIDPLKGGGHYPSVLLCGQHNGFGPCPGAPRCTPRDAETEVA